MILIRIFYLKTKKSQSCPKLYDLFSYKIWEEDLSSRFGRDWYELFKESFHPHDVDAAADAMGLVSNDCLPEAIIYRLLNNVTKLKFNSATGNLLKISDKLIRGIEFCDICDKHALVRGDNDQHKRHFSSLAHQKIEDRTFERIFLSAGKLCLLCKREVILITEDEMTRAEILSYKIIPPDHFVNVKLTQPHTSGRFAVYKTCRDVVCINCIRKKRVEAMWKLVKEALLPYPDYRHIFIKMITVLSQCMVCHKHSESVIPSKYFIWDKSEKAKIKSAYFKALTRRKCRFEMRLAC